MTVQNSADWAQAILQTVADAVLTVDEQGIIDSFNPAAENIFQYRATDAIGLDVRELMPDHDGLLAVEHAARPAESQSPRIVSQRRELDGRRQDGSTFPIDLAVTVVELGGRRRFTMIVRDLTERLQAQKKVQRLAAIVEAVDDAIISYDTDGIIESWNGGAEALYGYTAQEAIGKPLAIIAPDNSASTLEKRFRTVLAGTKLECLETKRLTKDRREIDVSISGCRILDARGQVVGLASVHRDIAVQKQTERAKRKLAVVEERNRLAREIHDSLAQSLSAITIQLHLAAGTIVCDPAAARADIEASQMLANRCVEDARRAIWDLQPKVLETHGLTDAVRIEVQRLEERGIKGGFRVSGDETTPIDGRNQSAALRVVQEALSNVIKHSKAKTAEVSLNFGQDGLLITVTDDGIGFDHRASRPVSPSGGGFGLASMRERARLAGGSIRIQSTLGQGAAIEVRIPYQPA